MKSSIYLNRHVFVMDYPRKIKNLLTYCCWFVACVLSVLVYLLFLFVSLSGYIL